MHFPLIPQPLLPRKAVCPNFVRGEGEKTDVFVPRPVYVGEGRLAEQAG
jgi:hypothetical protein